MQYKIELDNFEGPLDLLLHFVKESKMDIYEINISNIIKSYLDYINELQEKNIDIASEYLVMGAELIHLKSKMLLNIKDDEDDQFAINSEEELKTRLIEYEKYKNVTDMLKELEAKRSEIITKSPENLSEYLDPDTKLNSEITLTDLLDAFINYQKRMEHEKPVTTKITKKELSVEQRTHSIRELLRDKKQVKFTSLFEEYNKPYVIVTFLALLNMTKNNEINLIQENNFCDIVIESRES